MFSPVVIRSGRAQDPLKKYADVAALPMEKRRSAFIEASAKEKSDLFRTHLALYLARHAELNEDQKQIILEGMSLATPERYEVRSDSADWKARVEEPMKQSEIRIRSAFSREEGARIFATLGDQGGQDLLEKYRDICALPMKKRKDAFRKASPADASDLWRTHLALYLARHPELNDPQSQTILDAMSLATPEFFLAPPAKVQEHVMLFENRVREIFSRIEGGKIFATLGEPDPSQTLKGSTPLLQTSTKVETTESTYRTR